MLSTVHVTQSCLGSAQIWNLRGWHSATLSLCPVGYWSMHVAFVQLEGTLIISQMVKTNSMALTTSKPVILIWAMGHELLKSL